MKTDFIIPFFILSPVIRSPIHFEMCIRDSKTSSINCNFTVEPQTFTTDLKMCIRDRDRIAGSTCNLCYNITVLPDKGIENRRGRSEGPPNRETEDDYSAFMQAISLSTVSYTHLQPVILTFFSKVVRIWLTELAEKLK